MQGNAMGSQSSVRPALVLLAISQAIASGCFSREGYGTEVSMALPVEVAGPGAGSGAPAGAGGSGVGTGGDTSTGTPTGGTGGSPGATDGGLATPDGGTPPPTDAGMTMMPPASCEGEVVCTGGKAGMYGCKGVNYLGHLTPQEMQGSAAADSWGWTDAMSGKEYVVVGMDTGTSFIDISNPCNPVHLGHLRTNSQPNMWRDVKVYKDHAYSVSEAQGHGMQVFDLTKLRNVPSPPQAFQADNVLTSFGSAHVVIVNEESGYAYAVATNNCPSARSISLADPKNPVDQGCWNTPLRIHEGQCVNYHGPDTRFAGKEICLTGDEGSGFSIYDVTNKAAVTKIVTERYAGVAYAHQGWMTEDHKYLIFSDELDEQLFRVNTTLYLFDLTDLTNPVSTGKWVGTLPAIDHNIYIRGNYAYMAAYSAGLRVFDITNIGSGSITEIGFFDTYPANDSAQFLAMWAPYPWFKSGVVTTSGAEGFFVLRPDPAWIQ
jgi:choice-of-anchor B domain-containing protein